MITPGKSTRRRNYVIIALAVAIPIVFLSAISLFSSQPDNLGVHQGQLAACPAADNCVSTQAAEERHKIAPIEFTGSAADAMQAVKKALATMPRITIVSEDEHYLHAEARSLVFRFVDDVEFFVDESNHLIQFRSASRAGYSDLGANRSRMETFRAAFAQPQ